VDSFGSTRWRYKMKSVKNKSKDEQLLIRKMKPLANEEGGDKLLHKIKKDMFPEFYFRNYNFVGRLYCVVNDCCDLFYGGRKHISACPISEM
jgi:hypothetical protein